MPYRISRSMGVMVQVINRMSHISMRLKQQVPSVISRPPLGSCKYKIYWREV